MKQNCHTDTVEGIATGLAQVVRDIQLADIGSEFIPALWRILIDGRPASAEEISVAANRPVNKINEAIARLPDVELDREGRVLGFALTLLPTPHRVLAQDRDHMLYTWCVPDALMVPAITGVSVSIVSRCPATRQTITVNVSERGVEKVDPPSAMVSWWLPAAKGQEVRATTCMNQSLFASAAAAASWMAQRSGSCVVTPSEALHASLRALQMGGWLKPEQKIPAAGT